MKYIMLRSSRSNWKCGLFCIYHMIKITNFLIEADAGEDSREQNFLNRELRTDLLGTGASSVDFVSSQVPAAIKALDPITIGTAALAVLPRVIPKLYEILKTWPMRAGKRKIRMNTKVFGRSVELEYLPSQCHTKN
jgi:hypothetical protein